MSLHQKIREDMKEAMRAKEALRLSVIRSLLSAFTNEAVAKGRKPDEELSDDEVLTLVSRAVKQRKDSVEQFEKGGRPELAEAERSELAILTTYLPAQMSCEEVESFVAEKIKELGPVDKSKAGQFMGQIMKDLKGRVDGTLVKEVIDNLIA